MPNDSSFGLRQVCRITSYNVCYTKLLRGTYDPGVSGCPDFNPRGCQKGACASDLFVRPQRLRYPLVRVGERGEGRFKRVSWDEALDLVAEAVVDAVARQGGGGLLLESGPEMDYGPHTVAPLRLFRNNFV